MTDASCRLPWIPEGRIGDFALVKGEREGANDPCLSGPTHIFRIVPFTAKGGLVLRRIAVIITDNMSTNSFSQLNTFFDIKTHRRAKPQIEL